MMNLLKLRKPYLNLHLDSKKYYTRVIERPGLWMTETELKELVEDLREVVLSISIGGLEYGIVQGSKEALDQAVLTVIYSKKDNRPFAFNALTMMNCLIRGQQSMVLHLGLVVVDPNSRERGLSWILYGLTTFLLFFKNRFKPVWISNVTQVPAIIGMVSESFGNVFPNPLKENRRTFDHILLAREILGKHRKVFGVGIEAEFDEENFIIKNSYTGGSDNLKKTYEQAPKHRNLIYNDFCQKHLDYHRGDDFLQIGQIDIPTYYHYMSHSVPIGSRINLVYKVLFNVFELSFLPIFQWFSTSKSMGVLRTRGSSK
jgi:hypothetical protein